MARSACQVQRRLDWAATIGSEPRHSACLRFASPASALSINKACGRLNSPIYFSIRGHTAASCGSAGDKDLAQGKLLRVSVSNSLARLISGKSVRISHALHCARFVKEHPLLMWCPIAIVHQSTGSIDFRAKDGKDTMSFLAGHVPMCVCHS